MSGRGVDDRAGKHTDDEKCKKEVEALGEAARFLATASAELESLHVAVGILTATVGRRSGASAGDSRRQTICRREL